MVAATSAASSVGDRPTTNMPSALSTPRRTLSWLSSNVRWDTGCPALQSPSGHFYVVLIDRSPAFHHEPDGARSATISLEVRNEMSPNVKGL